MKYFELMELDKDNFTKKIIELVTLDLELPWNDISNRYKELFKKEIFEIGKITKIYFDVDQNLVINNNVITNKGKKEEILKNIFSKLNELFLKEKEINEIKEKAAIEFIEFLDNLAEHEMENFQTQNFNFNKKRENNKEKKIIELENKLL